MVDFVSCWWGACGVKVATAENAAASTNDREIDMVLLIWMKPLQEI